MLILNYKNIIYYFLYKQVSLNPSIILKHSHAIPSKFKDFSFRLLDYLYFKEHFIYAIDAK
ncbi:unnamed protein product [Pneumocystis jirovecii]|uniref:Uncharacterized protein n=1 Tax=Pneumocystis jirovecii TaxID=42068 RepID=L0PC57_PNEJI|nr:unnamed protein product [Pneumocystis jirovecii]